MFLIMDSDGDGRVSRDELYRFLLLCLDARLLNPNISLQHLGSWEGWDDTTPGEHPHPNPGKRLKRSRCDKGAYGAVKHASPQLLISVYSKSAVHHGNVCIYWYVRTTQVPP